MPAKVRCRGLLTLLLLLSLAIAARGAQPVDSSSTPHASCAVYCYCDSGSGFHSSSGFDQADKTYNPYLARIGKEFLDPPDEAADWNTLPAGARALPGVPAAIFMVLTGFLCVSFVNDRRIWLASLAGLLWLGQTGLSAIPQAASHLTGKKDVTQNHPHNFVGAGKGRYRLRSDIEGTQYIGLLRHLAGIPSTVIAKEPQAVFFLIASTSPDSQKACKRKRISRIVIARSAATWQSPTARTVRTVHLLRKSEPTKQSRNPGLLRCARNKLRNLDTLRSGLGCAHSATPEFAIAQTASDISNSTVCLARAAEHFVPFSPAFAFANLARGPP